MINWIMIYWIISILVFFLVISIIILFKKNKELRLLNKTLTDNVVEAKTAPILIWKVTKYKEEDLNILLTNPEVVDLLISIFEYKIFIKTDSIRSSEDTEKKIWFLDALHEMHLFFYKLKQKLNKKNNKIWQNLV